MDEFKELIAVFFSWGISLCLIVLLSIPLADSPLLWLLSCCVVLCGMHKLLKRMGF